MPKNIRLFQDDSTDQMWSVNIADTCREVESLFPGRRPTKILLKNLDNDKTAVISGLLKVKVSDGSISSAHALQPGMFVLWDGAWMQVQEIASLTAMIAQMRMQAAARKLPA